MNREEYNYEESKRNIFGIILTDLFIQFIIMDIYMPIFAACMIQYFGISIGYSIKLILIRSAITFVTVMCRPVIITVRYFIGKRSDDVPRICPKLSMIHDYTSIIDIITSLFYNMMNIFIIFSLIVFSHEVDIQLIIPKTCAWMIFDIVISIVYFFIRKHIFRKRGYV